MSHPDEIRLASRDLGGGRFQTDLSVPGARCAACIGKIEKGLGQLPGVEAARMNLTARRVSVTWRGDEVPDMVAALEGVGFQSHLTGAQQDDKDPELSRLVRALCVAGFGAMNIMMLSVSVWSGADPQTRQAFHWISAAIALPCLIYSGRIFFQSAWSALRHGQTNMDVPISIGVILAFGLSLFDTIGGGEHAYFDASISLLFFLLIGRTLDHMMRDRARTAVAGLARLAPRGATVLQEDGRREHLPVDQIEPGMKVLLAAGDRVPVDGVVLEGLSELDCALATGESEPRRVEAGSPVQAGVLNLTGPLILAATARARDSFLSEMVALMQAAEGGRATYRRIADRASALYAPVVHTAAFATFLGWMLASGDWHRAITVAIAVLIITCPCALGLAVPMVQVMAASRLFRAGVMVKDGGGLERLAAIDTVVFDKTGTLTLGRPRVVNATEISAEHLALASSLARGSNHPVARAIADEGQGPGHAGLQVVEHPGLGLEARHGGHLYRLGRATWALDGRGASASVGTVLARDGHLLAEFTLEDTLRPQAREAVAELKALGVRLLILSGDTPDAVAGVAERLGIADHGAGLYPADKVARLSALAAEGRKVLMVGDGLNDAPALVAAHVSMAPGEAADIGRNAADFVFLHKGLEAVPTSLRTARRAGQLVKQNFALAIGYNLIALPVAVAGLVTPLIAALAMSLSSIIVVANAMRLRGAPTVRQTAGKSIQRRADMPASPVEATA